MTVAIILLNWRNATDTLVCVESILKSSCQEFQIFVCDNASNDGSEELFLKWATEYRGIAAQEVVRANDEADRLRIACSHRVVWIQTGANLGFAGGNNVGIRLAFQYGAFDYFWLVNNDCEVDAKALEALIRRVEEDPRIGICGALLRYFHAGQDVQAYGGARHNRWTGRAFYLGHLANPSTEHDTAAVEQEMTYVCGASMFVRREFIETVGLMNEDYFLFFEEIDWALRGRGRFRLGYAPQAVVFHKEGATIGSSSDTRKTSRLADFYMNRNRLRFTAKFYPLAVPSVWLVMFLQAIKRGLRGQSDRMWLIVQILLGKVSP